MTGITNMENVLFLQSEVSDPYSLYEIMLHDRPVHYDPLNKLWAIYSFADCHSILNSSTAIIPKSKHLFSNESDEVKYIIHHLARLSNPPIHTAARKATASLMMRWKKPDTASLLHYLIGEPRKPCHIDWVQEVCKKLPALALLKGFNFSSPEIEVILPQIESLTMMMMPSRSVQQNTALNEAVATIIKSIDSFVLRNFNMTGAEELNLYSANLIGLLIQSYDAGRGLLSNALLQLVKSNRPSGMNIEEIDRVVKETLRYDPAVHNTRRTLTEAMTIQGQPIPAGENLLLVLAAANRDPKQFKDSATFNPLRSENIPYLTYGAGIHHCMAEHFSIHLTTTALHYLFTKYDLIQLEEQQIHYEPKVNVRLPVRINLLIS